MKHPFPQPEHHQWFGLLAIAAILVGMLFSKVLVSMGMIGLAVNTVFNWGGAAVFRRFLQHKALLALSGIFLFYLLSGLYSENVDFLFRRLRLTLPLLLLPLVILSVPRFDRRIYYSLLYGFFLLVALMCLYSMGLYLKDYERVTELYKQGQVLYTPVMHIRFSLMVAYCVAIGGYLWAERFYWFFPWERWLLLGLSGFLFIFLHVLAVRSGLLALYGVLGFALMRTVVRNRQYILALAAVAALVLGVWLAVQYLPTLKNKIGYTRYSIDLFLKGENLEDLSDSHRLGSMLAGLEISRQHPWTGVGIGDILDECEAYYQQHLPALAGEKLMPHNQYLFMQAATGFFGLLYFLWATLYPLYYRAGYRNGLIVSFHLIALSSFMVEHTLETQIGLAFYLTFALLSIRFQDGSTENPQP
jgi:O-antigen ligase